MIDIILDVDTGIDDALAILFAVKHPEINLLAITCVEGNASIQKVTANTLAILDILGVENVPMAAGATKPLIERPRNSSAVHGLDGLGDLRLPPSARSAMTMSAIDLLRTTLSEAERPVTIVSLAPMTNIALLIAAYPGLSKKIERIVFMGGAIGKGNATAVAEFNVWHDPEAAYMVLNSGVPCSMYCLDVFEQVRVSKSEARKMASSEHLAVSTAGRLLSYTSSGAPGDAPADHFGLLGDAGALCAVVQPNLVQSKDLLVHVNLAPGAGRGQTIVDLRTSPGEDSLHGGAVHAPHVDVIHSVDAEAMVNLFSAVLSAAAPAGQDSLPA